MNVCLKLVGAAFVLLSVTSAHAQNVHGVLRVVKGQVEIKSGKSGQTARARIGEKVFPKDVVITGKEARAKIVMVDNNEINVSPESQIEIQHYEYDPAQGKKDVLLNVIYGKVRSKVEQKYDGKTTKFQIKTPSAVAGVRGTDFITGFNPSTQASTVVTFHGKVEFGLPGAGGTITGAVMVTPGQQASVDAGKPPAAPTPVSQKDLAKMDGESKAEGPKSDEGAADDRTPAGESEKKEKKEDAKKEDGAKKEEAPKKEDTAKKEDAPKKEDTPKKEDAPKKNDQAKSDDSKGGRSPASSGGSTTGPKTGAAPAPAANPSASAGGPPPPGAGPAPAPGGGCSMCGPPEAPPPPPIVQTAPPTVNLPSPNTGELCGQQCRGAIESNNKANVIIKVINKSP